MIKELTISKSKRHSQSCIFSKHNWLQSVIEAKVATPVHNDTHTRNHKASVETSKTIRSNGLTVHINHTIELPLTTSLFGMITLYLKNEI